MEAQKLFRVYRIKKISILRIMTKLFKIASVLLVFWILTIQAIVLNCIILSLISTTMLVYLYHYFYLKIYKYRMWNKINDAQYNELNFLIEYDDL